MDSKTFSGTFFLIAQTLVALSAAALESPSGNYDFDLSLVDGVPTYQVSYEGKVLIEPSALGFERKGGGRVGAGVSAMAASEVKTVEETWKPVYGERAVVTDHYRSQVYTFETGDELGMKIEVRCYDEGVAFCYHLAGKGRQVLSGELTEFVFPQDHVTWTATNAQSFYEKRRISEMGKVYDRPQIFHAEEDDLFVAVGEARLVDFARMKLSGEEKTVRARLSGEVVFEEKITSPWRFVMAGRTAGDLLENNDLLLNLSEPCAIEDTSWIKPGKVLREVTLTDTGARRAIDFAAANGIAYVHFDAGWYGHEYDDAQDATTVTLDPKRSKGPLHLPELVAYAKERGVGVTVYVNQRALTKQLDEILPLYQKWGIAGIKYGFVHVGSQEHTRWLHEAVRKAADYEMMVDIHDEYRPTGYSRTYPNLMTQEGIGGDETAPTPKQTLGIFFPRYLAGAADNTICYYDGRVAKKMNHAFQLGKTVCCYSPWQFIFWYDRPNAGKDGGEPFMGRDEPELVFFKDVPVVWDESRVLGGEIEEFVVMARRAGAEWYLGAMNAESPRKFTAKLDFLEPGKDYLLRSYTHDESVPTQTKVRIAEEKVTAESVLEMDVSANDGAAYRLIPQGE
ncbi:MAG: glycoside hydrolase family 97 N-terminal domain-containing protein [Verrucomicrobiales bacterium]